MIIAPRIIGAAAAAFPCNLAGQQDGLLRLASFKNDKFRFLPSFFSHVSHFLTVQGQKLKR